MHDKNAKRHLGRATGLEASAKAARDGSLNNAEASFTSGSLEVFGRRRILLLCGGSLKINITSTLFD